MLRKMGRLFANVAKNNSNNRMRTSCRRCRDSSKAKPNATTLGMKEYGLDTSIYMRMEYQSTKMQAIDRNIRPELSHAKRSTNCFKSVGTKIVEQACQKLATAYTYMTCTLLSDQQFWGHLCALRSRPFLIFDTAISFWVRNDAQSSQGRPRFLLFDQCCWK